MSYLLAFHGPTAAFILCALIFAEETGVPLPLAPGDLILLTAGVLIAGGELSPWLFLPLAIAAAMAGAITGYSWTRLLGSAGLHAVARRLGITRHVDRLSDRLESAGPRGILVCRLLPGLRVTTTLVAGALGVRRSTFLLGLLPSIVIWVIAFTAAGALAGIPIAHVLSRVDRLALRAAILLAVGCAGYLAARHFPALRGSDSFLAASPGPWRIALAVAIDLLAILGIIAGLDLVAHVVLQIGEIDDWKDATVTTTCTMLTYLVLARGSIGVTAGEALFRITYRSRRWLNQAGLATLP